MPTMSPFFFTFTSLISGLSACEMDDVKKFMAFRGNKRWGENKEGDRCDGCWLITDKHSKNSVDRFDTTVPEASSEIVAARQEGWACWRVNQVTNRVVVAQ